MPAATRFSARIARGVAGIVQGLEVVEIDIEHRQRQLVCGGDIVGQQPVERGPVQKPGQGVVTGRVGEFLLVQLVLGDVAHGAQELPCRVAAGE